MKVENVMHRDAEWRTPDTSLKELAELMRDQDIGSVPIGENDRLVGMVTDRDICCRGVAQGADPDKVTARDVMSQEIQWCRADDDLEEAMERMESRQIRRLPVIDDNKRLVGMLSLGDIATAASASEIREVTRAVAAHH